MVCSENQVCVNTPGSSACECLAGYHKVSNTCEGRYIYALQKLTIPIQDFWFLTDTDECSSVDFHDCDESGHQVCFNTPGSYICNCEKGFQEVESTCKGTI